MQTDRFDDGTYYDFADLRKRNVITSRTSLHRHLQAGEFPPPVRFPGNRISWPGSMVNRYLGALEQGLSPAEAVEIAVSRAHG